MDDFFRDEIKIFLIPTSAIRQIGPIKTREKYYKRALCYSNFSIAPQPILGPAAPAG